MLLVRTKIKESEVHGIGLYADEFIPQGTLVWKFTPGFDKKFTAKQISEFPDLLQIYLYKYTWKSKKSGMYCFCSDNGKHFNHSENPNVLSEYRDNEDESLVFAIKDINIGEELLDDYSSFEDISNLDKEMIQIIEKFNLKDEIDPRVK